MYNEDEILSFATEENKSEESSDDEQTVDLGHQMQRHFVCLKRQ